VTIGPIIAGSNRAKGTSVAHLLHARVFQVRTRLECDGGAATTMSDAGGTTSGVVIDADPALFQLERQQTALVIIDMQRDFLEPGGFGESLGNDVTLLRSVIAPCVALLAAAREAGMTVIHTREGHRADLSDTTAQRLSRGEPGRRIGDPGPMGRILIRGEPGHGIIPELAPLAGEPVIDKPGKGAFYSTDLELILQSRQIRTLLVCGVTTEVCVHSTVRDANDRGYRCLVVGDACGSYFPEFHDSALKMLSAQGGIFGWVSDSTRVLNGLQRRDGARP